MRRPSSSAESKVENHSYNLRDASRTDLAAMPRVDRPAVPSDGWLTALRRYIVAIGLGNLVWEFAQLPLYTIWHRGSPGEILFAVFHCTGGDLLIAGSALIGALVVVGDRSWPYTRFGVVALITVLCGLAYTVFSEWLNTEIRGSWVYTDWMPTLPLIGAGLAPFAQWLLVPPLALWWARRGVSVPLINRAQIHPDSGQQH
jgi:hypothetical protein